MQLRRGDSGAPRTRSRKFSLQAVRSSYEAFGINRTRKALKLNYYTVPNNVYFGGLLSLRLGRFGTYAKNKMELPSAHFDDPREFDGHGFCSLHTVFIIAFVSLYFQEFHAVD